MENEIRAFLISPDELNSTNLHNFQSSGKQFSTKASIIHNKFNKRSINAKRQILLCRIVVGRVLDEAEKVPNNARSTSSLISHSEVTGTEIFACRGTCLAYPEYIITYTDTSAPGLNTQSLDSPQQTGRSSSKMCVICMERPVRYLTIPCG